MSVEFSDGSQRVLVVRTLFKLCGSTAHLWDDTNSRPFPLIDSILVGGTTGYTTLDICWMRVVLDVWNGNGGATFNEILELDTRLVRALGALLIASHSSKNIAAWCEIWA